MAVDTTSQRSRRVVLGAGLGAAAATLATALGRSDLARAANDAPILAGRQDNAATHSTGITTTVGDGFEGTTEDVNGRGLSGGAPQFGVGASVGVEGFSQASAGIGVSGWVGHSSGATRGVQGRSYSTNGTGVYGRATAETGATYGVYGRADSSAGTAMLGYAGATSGTTYGVLGYSNSPSGKGGAGWSGANSTGLIGYSNDGTGSVPAALPKTGVYGSAPLAGGRGGQFTGATAQIRLRPSTATSHPASGQRGDLFVDASGRLWFCKGGTTWKQLA